jgi:hypothetical protein
MRRSNLWLWLAAALLATASGRTEILARGRMTRG